jgi:cytochrome c oxidase assembly factor CtaG
MLRAFLHILRVAVQFAWLIVFLIAVAFVWSWLANSEADGGVWTLRSVLAFCLGLLVLIGGIVTWFQFIKDLIKDEIAKIERRIEVRLRNSQRP